MSQQQGSNQPTIRPRALDDIEHHADYLEQHATPEIALRFRTAIMEAVDAIGFMPGAGSPQAVRNPKLSTLRMRLVPGFRNYLLFYITPEGNAEIIRLLHAAQDRLAILEAEE